MDGKVRTNWYCSVGGIIAFEFDLNNTYQPKPTGQFIVQMNKQIVRGRE